MLPGSEPAKVAAPELGDRRAVRAWALYDFGNSAFATTVMAGFFPIFFKQYWSAEVDASVSTFRLGVASSVASILIALAAPLLGAIADQGGTRKRMLAAGALLGACATMLLAAVPQGQWLPAASLYSLACFGFAASIVFYDSLIVVVAGSEESHRVSALGYALGYLGGGLLFALNVAMTLAPERFGLPDKAAAVRASFVMVGLWWLVFTLPLLRHVPEERKPARGALNAIAGGLRELSSTLRRIRRDRNLWTFLLAYWLYIDGVDTVIRMAVDYGLSLGLAASSLITALLITQFVGFPAAIAVGKLAGRLGAKRTILLCLCVYVAVTTYG
jgi:UMF1 family MFS transporter